MSERRTFRENENAMHKNTRLDTTNDSQRLCEHEIDYNFFFVDSHTAASE